MSRLPLQNGEKIKLDAREYTIDSIIGSGATCIVYSAYYIDSFNFCHKVNIKECYPYTAKIERKNHELVWDSDSEKQKHTGLFTDAYKKLMVQQNGNFSVHAFDICESNNTFYIVMDQNEGKTFDSINDMSVEEILKTVKLLSHVVGTYHDNGYLHLDIKPENFLVYPRPSEHIVLFDLDTITKTDDLQNGNVISVSYSDKWAAPEQKQKKLSKIGKGTDIFAIGSVLFEKIMGRPVQCEDMGLFADWDFDSRFTADKMHPCVVRMLKNIYQKALSANIKKRYQSTKELEEDLQEVINVIASGKPYIVSKYPTSTCKFFGRELELSEIEDGLDSFGKVFVYGSGGIGKTELAKQYIKTHKEKYDSVVFIKYDKSVKADLDNITIKGVYDKDDKYGALLEICDERTLIVLDNFDVASDEDDGLERLLELSCHTIITTRNREFANLYEDTSFVWVADLETEYLRRIFEEESQIKVGYKEFARLPMLHLFKECTLFLVLVAKLIKAGDYTLSEVCEKIGVGLAETDEAEDILNTKDGFRIKQTVAKAMQNLFKLEKFSPAHWEILHIIYHLGCLNLDRRQIKEIASLDKEIPINKKMNAFNDLLERSLIDCAEDDPIVPKTNGYVIRDVLKDVMDYSFDTSLCHAPIVNTFIWLNLITDKEDILLAEDMDHELERDIIMNKVICLFKIFANKKHLLDEEVEYFIDISYEMFAGEEPLGYYLDNDYGIKILEKVIKCAEDKTTNSDVRLKAYSLWLVLLCSQIRVSVEKEIQIKAAKTVKYIFEKAAKIIEENDIQDEKLIDNLCKPIKTKVCGPADMCELMDVSIIKQIIKWNPLCIRKIETPRKSFEIRALQNSDYEKDYWYGVEKIIEDMEEEEREEFVYKALGKLLLNGDSVAAQVDDELKDLRFEMFGLCYERYDDFDAVDPLDFAPDPIGMPKMVTVVSGWRRFLDSITEKDYGDCNESKDFQESVTERFPELKYSYKGKITEEDLDEFLERLSEVHTAEGLCVAISQFRDLLRLLKKRAFTRSQSKKMMFLFYISDNISDYEEKGVPTFYLKDLMIIIKERCSEEKLMSMRESIHELKEALETNEEFVSVDLFEKLFPIAIGEPLAEAEEQKIETIVDMFDEKFSNEEIQEGFPYYREWDINQIYLDDVKAELESLKAPLYCLLDDEENVEKSLDTVLKHSRENLQNFGTDGLINFENSMDSDFCFWEAFNWTKSYDGVDIVLPYLVKYTDMVKQYLERKGDFKEKCMYSYYKKIVESAEEYLDETKEKSLLFAIFGDEEDEIPPFIQKRQLFSQWYETYKKKMEEIAGIKFIS